MHPFQPLNDDSFSFSESLLTASSSSTVWGPRALSGKALKHLTIRMRLAKIKRAIEKTPHVFHDPRDAIESQRMNEYHSDLKELCEVKHSLSVRRAAGDLIRKITLIETPERPDRSSSSVEKTPTLWEVLLASLLLPGGVLFSEEVNHSSFRPHFLRSLCSESDGHTDWVTSVAFSYDGKRIVTGSFDRTIRVWNADTGEVMWAPFEGHTASVRSVVFSHDGKRIVSGSEDKTIRVWNADSGEVISAPFEGHTHTVTSVAFSHDGKRIVSGSFDKTLRVWNADTGELISAPFEGHTDWVTSVSFSHDGKRIVSGSNDKTIRVWNAFTGEPIPAPFEGHTQCVMTVAFSQDGKRIVSGSYDMMIRVWNADNGELISAPFEGHTDWVRSVAFSHDGKRIVSGSDDKTIRVWNADTGEVISAPFEGHTRIVTSVAFSHWIFSGSRDDVPDRSHDMAGEKTPSDRLMRAPKLSLLEYLRIDSCSVVSTKI